MKKTYLITYEEWQTGNKEIKTTRWICEESKDVFLDFITPTKWILKIKELKK